MKTLKEIQEEAKTDLYAFIKTEDLGALKQMSNLLDKWLKVAAEEGAMHIVTEFKKCVCCLQCEQVLADEAELFLT